METEAAIMANFDYLGHSGVEMDEEDLADDMDDQQDDEQVDVKLKRKKNKVCVLFRPKSNRNVILV